MCMAPPPDARTRVRTCGPSGTIAVRVRTCSMEQNRTGLINRRNITYYMAQNMCPCLTLTAEQYVRHNTPSECMRHWCSVRHAGLVQNGPCQRGRGEKQCGELEAKLSAKSRGGVGGSNEFGVFSALSILIFNRRIRWNLVLDRDGRLRVGRGRGGVLGRNAASTNRRFDFAI